MADIFISWGSPDKTIVQEFSARLTAGGLDVFEYSEEMQAGDEISPRVNQELNAARLVVFCVSNLTMARKWFLKEVNWCEKALLDKKGNANIRFENIAVVRVGPRTDALPDFFRKKDLFEFDLSAPAAFEVNLEKLVSDIRDKLALAAPVVVPAAILAFTQDQFKNLTASGKKRLEPLCKKMGMQSPPELEVVLANRYGPQRTDFKPFPGGRLVNQVNEALKVANFTRHRNRRAPVWLSWCTEELFSEDAGVQKRARDRWFSNPSLLVLDSLSLSIKKEDLIDPKLGPDLLNDFLQLSAYANPSNTALLWVPPYTEHTAELENIIENSLQSLNPLDRIYKQWKNADSAPYVAFDIGTSATLRRWLYGAFEDLEFEEPQPWNGNVATMRSSFQGNVDTGGFFRRVIGGRP